MNIPHDRPAPDARMPFGLRAGLSILRRRPLVFLALGWAIGTIVGYTCCAPWLIWLAPALAFTALSLWRRRLACLCAAFLFLSALIVGYCAQQPEPIDKQSRSIAGEICAEPRYYDEYTLLTLNSVSMDGEGYPHRVRLYLYPDEDSLPLLQYGDHIETTASVASPKGATGDGAYDTSAYLWRNGVALTGNASMRDTIYAPGDPSPMRSVMRLRSLIGERLDRLYPENGALARALLLGDKSMLSDEDYAAFQDAGIVHLLAVSGLHVSILAEAIRIFLRKALRLSRRAAYWIVLPLLVLYAALTGFPASILRAFICFALLDAAPLLSRSADRLTGLSAAFLLLCWLDPLSAFDAGFQLSFSAMLGLCLISPVLASVLTPPFMLRTDLRKMLWSPLSTIATSISASLGTLPIAAGLFGGLTLWSLAANILAIPITSAIMPVLLLSLALEQAAVPGRWALGVLDSIALWFGTMPEKLYLSVPRMAWGFMAAYALIALLCSAQTPVRGLKRRTAKHFKALGVLLMVLIAAVSTAWMKAPVLSEAGLTITFIDVGQGDSALVNAQGRCYMIDTGENSAAAGRLASRAIDLEALFLTHPDSDHAGAAAQVIKAGKVDSVYLPECWDRLDVPEEIASALENCEKRYLCAGDVVNLSGDVRATVLHPPKGYMPETDNSASLVLLIEYADGSALMTGDIADGDIIFDIPDCDLVKLAHHGSESSSKALLLRGTSPAAAILSVGLNSYNHPAPEVLDRLENMGIPYYRTDERGDISAAILPGGGVSIECWLEGEPTEAA